MNEEEMNLMRKRDKKSEGEEGRGRKTRKEMKESDPSSGAISLTFVLFLAQPISLRLSPHHPEQNRQ